MSHVFSIAFVIISSAIRRPLWCLTAICVELRLKILYTGFSLSATVVFPFHVVQNINQVIKPLVHFSFQVDLLQLVMKGFNIACCVHITTIESSKRHCPFFWSTQIILFKVRNEFVYLFVVNCDKLNYFIIHHYSQFIHKLFL